MSTKFLLMIFVFTLTGCVANKNEVVNPSEPDSMTTAGGCVGINCPNGIGTEAITH